MKVLSFESELELKLRLQECGIAFGTWHVPLRKRWLEYKAGEIQFLEHGDFVIIRSERMRLRILAERPEGLRFLQERKRFTAHPGHVTSSDSTSVSGKRRLLGNEDPYECLARELKEELEIEGAPVHSFRERYPQRDDDVPRISRSCPGLLKIVSKRAFEWVMEPQFQRDSYVETTPYGTNEFDWVELPDKIRKDLESRKLAA